jgi:hypothetical protein
MASIDAGKVTRVCPGTNQVLGMASRRRSSRIRGTPTRTPNSACENFTGGSALRTLSEIES